MEVSSGSSARVRPIVRCVRARLYYPRLMSRPFEKVALADAVGRLCPGMKVLLPPACADVRTQRRSSGRYFARPTAWRRSR